MLPEKIQRLFNEILMGATKEGLFPMKRLIKIYAVTAMLFAFLTQGVVWADSPVPRTDSKDRFLEGVKTIVVKVDVSPYDVSQMGLLMADPFESNPPVPTDISKTVGDYVVAILNEKLEKQNIKIDTAENLNISPFQVQPNSIIFLQVDLAFRRLSFQESDLLLGVVSLSLYKASEKEIDHRIPKPSYHPFFPRAIKPAPFVSPGAALNVAEFKKSVEFTTLRAARFFNKSFPK
jgi:hypothetical protein